MAKGSWSPRRRLRGCLMVFLPLVLAVCATALSASRQYPNEPSCGGMLGAGLPALFICDDWGGGSPTGSWGKIDFVDVINGGIKPGSFLIDLLFFTILIWVAWYLGMGAFPRGRGRQENYYWAAMLSIGYLVGLLTGYMIFRPDGLFLERAAVRTPTPVSPSPTPLGTLPPAPTPEATPAASIGDRQVSQSVP